jgi:hypothetical protein
MERFRQKGSARLYALLGVLGLSIGSGVVAVKTGAISLPTGAAPALAASPAPVAGHPPEEDEAPSAQELSDWIDSMAGHPDDPGLPKDFLGASDPVLEASDPQEIAVLLSQTMKFVEEESRSPRLLFELGRAAGTFGYEKHARRLLEHSVKSGYAPAKAYLAYLELDSGKEDRAKALLTEALREGFDNGLAREMLTGLTGSGQEQSRHAAPGGKLNLDDFERPDLIRAFHDQDFSKLQSDDWFSFIYVSVIHSTLWAGGDILFYADNRILLELDPQVGVQARYKMASSASVMEESMGMSVGSLMAGLQAAQGALNGANPNDLMGSLIQGAASMNRASGALPLKVQYLREQAEKDARRLAFGFEGDPETFRRIYRGMAEFVKRQ